MDRRSNLISIVCLYLFKQMFMMIIYITDFMVCVCVCVCVCFFSSRNDMYIMRYIYMYNLLLMD